MPINKLGGIRQVMPVDNNKVLPFGFVQAGGAGDIAVRFKGGDVTIISEALLSKMSITPVGEMDEVLATGTTATDIYVW